MPVEYEPFSADVRDDPYPHYAALRERAPLHFAEEAQAWCVSRYEDVRAVLRDAESFSSDAMRTMLFGAKPGANPMTDPAAMQRALAIAEALPFSMPDLLGARNLISEDPPRHGPLRGLVNRGFTPRRIAEWEARMRDVASECVARLRDGGDFDVVADLAIPLPITIIAEMLGVEPERRADFKHWSDVLVASVSGSGRERDPRENGLAASLQAVCEYAMEVAARRRREPGDDLISVLLSAQEGDVALTDVELALFVQLLLVAGNETTTNLIGNATNALLRHREQLARVRADRSLVPALVEETLRWDGPIQFLFRRATREVDLPSGRIPANAHVVALIGSANRDERQWGRTAERFDVGRDTTGHLAFGLGNHFCLGASLARLEARVALEALVGELARFEAREARVEYVDSFLVRGPKTLPLRLAA